jgi:hypothetical protein
MEKVKGVNMVKYLMYLHENRTMKPVEIVLTSGGRRMRENDGRVTLSKIHCKWVWKCYNETPCTTNIC